MLPKTDAFMLLSVVNMKLRDCYSSFDELCDDLQEDKRQITDALKNIGYEYDAKHNNFRAV